MDNLEIENKIRHILTDQLGIGEERIRGDARLIEDLGLDSLDAVELAMKAEKSFNVEMSDEEMEGLKTVKDVVELVRQIIEHSSSSRKG
jgi:acyl carrier protein